MATVLLCARRGDDPRLRPYLDAVAGLGLEARVAVTGDDAEGHAAEGPGSSRVAGAGDGLTGVVTVGRRAASAAAAAARRAGLPWHDASAVALSGDRLQLLGRLTATGMPVPRFAAVDATTGEGVERLAGIPLPWRISSQHGRRVATVASVEALHDVAQAFTAEHAPVSDGRPAAGARRSSLLVVEPSVGGPAWWVVGLLDAGALRVVATIDVETPVSGAAGGETIRTPTALTREAQAHLAGLIARGCAALGLRQGPVVGRAVTVAGQACLVDIAPCALDVPASEVVAIISPASSALTLADLVVRHATGRPLDGYALDGRNCTVDVPGPDPETARARPDPNPG